jgi:trimeric autotransporter adhesin
VRSAFPSRVRAEIPFPPVTSVSPASIYLGSAAVTVTINGAGFLPSSVAYFQNLPLPLTTTYVSATQIKAQVPSADLAQTGTYQL